MGVHLDVLNEVRREWEAHRDSIEKRIKGWIDLLTDEDTRKRIIKARQSFHQWEPLRVYISAAQAMRKCGPTFSLRYGGQEVGTVIFESGTPYVSVPETTQFTNARDFQVGPETSTRFRWDSPDGQMFRKHFKTLTAEPTSPRRPREHFLESTIIREMRMKTNAKFDQVLSQIQPVLLYGILPFQIPLPFSASTGVPLISDRGGNMDILARRRGKDGQVRLSVWELKRPGAIDHAVTQSCIYAAVLRHMLRSASGSEWYKLFGFRRALPEPLEIEAVVLLSESKREECAAQVEALRNSRGATLGGDRISLSVAFYDDKTLRLTQFEEGSAVFL
jgi:hypothetical protein